MEHLFLMFLDHKQRRSTVGGTPLHEWSALRRDLYLTTHYTHNRQISMPPVGFDLTISVGERPAAAHLLRSITPHQIKWMVNFKFRPLYLQGKSPQCLMNRRRNGSRYGLVFFAEDKNLLSLLGIEARFIGNQARGLVTMQTAVCTCVM
jgi:hypothetical protein